MFKVKQILDCADRPLRNGIVRTVYGVDKNTNSFLIVDSFGGFAWIPIRACVAYNEKE